MIKRNQIFKISPNLLSQKIEDELVILDMNSDHYFGLDQVGSHIFELLKEGATLETLVGSLNEQYDVKQEQLEEDIAELLNKLLNNGLIS